MKFEALEPRLLLAAGWDVVLIDDALPSWDILSASAVEADRIIPYDSAAETADDVLSRVIELAEANDTRIDSLCILSHGAPGRFALGNEWVSQSTLSSLSPVWTRLGEVLADGADLLIFGCNVADDAGGQALLDRLGDLTGADVFASNNLTGVGGDWVLEVASAGDEEELAAGLDLPLNASLLDASDVSLANSAPVLDNTQSPTLTAENEDAGTPLGAVGTLVSSLVDFAVPSGQVDNVTDPDSGALLGIAVTSADTTNGTWHYSTDNGTNWFALGAVANNNARLLAADANTRIYFQPNADYNGTLASAITFRAWDQTSGTNGGTADTIGTSNSFLDCFSSASYSNNDGTQSWSTNWIENDIDGGGATGGNIDVPTPFLRVIASHVGDRIYREADLTGASAATFSFSLDNRMVGSDQVAVQVSGDGGSGYTTLMTITSATANGTLSFDISAYIASNTRVRFYVVQGPPGPSGNEVRFDDVQIETVTGHGGTTAFSSATDTASLVINAINDAPMINDQSLPNVDENGANGTSVGTVVASDPDAGDSLTYSITAGNTGGAFAIDPNTGEITVNNGAALDFETNPVFSLTVQVEDTGALTDDATVTINLNDLNESPSINDQSLPNIDENSANGTSVGTVVASDVDAGDSLTYTITAGNTGNAFAIDPNTGEITVNNSAALDFETRPVFNLTVRVEDTGALTDDATVTINLNEVNETPTINDQSLPNIDENSPDGTSVGTGVASDPDAGDSLTYKITSGNTGNAFAIDPDTGEVTVNNSGALDFGTDPVFNLTVQVKDTGALTDDAIVTIALNDLNESPIIDDQSLPNVDENAASGTLVGTVVASDPDAGDSLTYSITGGNTGNGFSISASSGQIRVNSSAARDFETNPVFYLTVEVEDTGGLTDTATVTINLNDLNETPTINDQSLPNLDENSANGTLVGTVVASDVDAGDSLTYTITGGNTGNAFAIDPNTGEITVNNSAALDFETKSVFSLTVQVEDTGALTDDATVTINLNDLNESPIINDQSLPNVDENGADGTPVGTVVPIDPDASDSLTYTITGGNTGNVFAIDPDTGEITVNNSAALDFETHPVFSLTVRVEDTGALTDTATVTINLNDLNESPSVADQDVVVLIGSPDGTAVGTMSATDPDSGDTLTYAITGGNGSGIFAIDAAAGKVTVADGAAPGAGGAIIYVLTVQVTDGGGMTDTATLTIDLARPYEPPSVDEPGSSGDENGDGDDTDREGNKSTPVPGNPSDDGDGDSPSAPDEGATPDYGGGRDPAGPAKDEGPPPVPAEPPEAGEPPEAVSEPQPDIPAEPEPGPPLPPNDVSPTPTAPQVVTELVKPLPPVAPVTAADVVSETAPVWESLDHLDEHMDEQAAQQAQWQTAAVGTTTGLTFALSVGYIVWSYQSSGLLLSVLSSLRLWRWTDPLPILEYWERQEHQRRRRKKGSGDTGDSEEKRLARLFEPRLTRHIETQ